MRNDDATARGLRAIIELGDEGYLELRARPSVGEVVDFEVVDVNLAAELAIGRSREQLIGRGVRELVSREHAAAVVEQLVGARAAGQVQLHELRVAEGRAAGLFRCKVIPKDGGVTVLGRRLGGRAEPEREALQERLRHVQKMESLGRLAGGIAHDFNNLLTPILAYTNMALDRLDEGAPLYEDLREIRDAADRAAALTRQILSFSRKQANQPAPTSLNEVVDGVARVLRLLIGEGVELRLELAEDLGRALVDPAQVEQALAGLAVQARDALDGEGRITVRTANLSFGEDDPEARSVGAPPGRYVLLEVHDSGAADERARETGLGLSIVAGLAARTGGYARCDRGPGGGAAFRVYLPRASEPAAEQPEDDGFAGPGEAGGAVTVLLVEDDEAVRRLARHLLAEHGYRVLEAECGASALELAASHGGAVDLLLTDVVMPRMDGRELHERLLALWPGLPVVFMSGYAEIEITSGRFLAKPFAASALLATVREALQG